MKTVYVNPADFHCHMQPQAGYIETNTQHFNAMCDEEIEQMMFVPLGYSHVDSTTGLHYTGEHLSNIYTAQHTAALLSGIPTVAATAETALAQATYTAMMTDTLAGEV